MFKILVTGGSGLLGSKIVNAGKIDYEIVPTHNTTPLFPNSIKLDILDNWEVSRILSHLRPDAVIHAAAESNVDRCETDKKHALAVNAEGTKNIAEACNVVGARLVYVSTDYVFDGEKGRYVEEDKPNPINYYGRTKLEGEKHVSEICENHVIARTSVLYGWHPRKQNFVTWAIDSLKQGKQISITDDHYNSPTLADNLAEVLLELADSEKRGVLHTAGSTRIDRFKLVLEIAKIFNLNPALVKPIKMAELKTWVAKRPRDSSLRIDKAKKTLKTPLWSVSEGLKFLRAHPE